MYTYIYRFCPACTRRARTRELPTVVQELPRQSSATARAAQLPEHFGGKWILHENV